MKRIQAIVAIRQHKGQAPHTVIRPGYELISGFHPGRKFALVREQSFSGKQRGWICVFQPEGYGRSELKAKTLSALRDKALAFLAATTGEQLDDHVRGIAIRRAKQLLGE